MSSEIGRVWRRVWRRVWLMKSNFFSFAKLHIEIGMAIERKSQIDVGSRNLTLDIVVEELEVAREHFTFLIVPGVESDYVIFRLVLAHIRTRI